MKESSAQAGFTLIEMLVVALLLGVFTAIATGTFSNIMKAQNKVRITNELERTGSYVLSRIEQDIRNADTVLCCGNCLGGIGEQGVGLLVGGAKVYYLVGQEGSERERHIFRQVGEDDSNGKALLTNDDPSSGVNVDSFVCDVYDESRVQVRLVLEQPSESPTRSEFRGGVEMQTTAVLRGRSY